jgi:hypothetical protein
MLGASFGKVIELSGFSKSIRSGRHPACSAGSAPVLSIVVVCAILTYGGVSLFVVVFAVYPFAAEMFRQSDIPKAAHSLHDRAWRVQLHDGCAAGNAADQNIIPTTFFKTDGRGPPRRLGSSAAVFVFGVGIAYIETAGQCAQKQREATATDF